MKFARRITIESLDAITCWNGGIEPGQALMNGNFYFVAGTHDTDLNQIMTEWEVNDRYIFTHGEMDGKFNLVERR